MSIYRFDKSFQLILFPDGHCGINVEHSFAVREYPL
jgi:hypothetical protein